MKSLPLALLLAGGCSGLPAHLSPVGPSYCVEGEGLTLQQVEVLDEARDRAVAYWDAAGLSLDSRCGQTAYLSVSPLPPPALGSTVTGGSHVPETVLDPSVLGEGWSRTAETVAHEMGHALGLSHSTDPASVMWPSVHDLPGAPVAADLALAAGLKK